MSGRLPLEYRVVVLQASFLGVATLVVFVLGGAPAWVLAGGVCILAPNAWMAWRVGMAAATGRELECALSLCLAMLAKPVFTVVLLLIVLSRAETIEGPAFFMGLIATLLGHHASWLVGGSGDDAKRLEPSVAAQVSRE